jgi:succinyl-CoA synthetase beta subunit
LNIEHQQKNQESMRKPQNKPDHDLTALSEHASKQILAAYGIPVTKEALASNLEEAVSMAESMGYPVVLKACAPELMHKSDHDCMALNIRNENELSAAYARIHTGLNIDLEGFLIQEMVFGNRELVLGMNRDPQFGPCIMLGMGGVLTEIINDTVFRVAPFDEIEAWDMIRGFRGRAMLDAFRGQEAADRKTICRCVVALSEISLARDDIVEIDINPLLIDRAGRVKAADALMVLRGDLKTP